MKCGTFIGIDWKQGVILGPNFTSMMMEEFMDAYKIDSPQNVVGDFETLLLDRGWKRPQDEKGWEDLHQAAITEAERIKAIQYRMINQMAENFYGRKKIG